LRANATSSRVSIHRDADQCAENDHSQIRKQQGSKSPTVLAYNYRATGGKKCTLSVAQHCILLRLRLHVSWFILSEPKGSLIVFPCGFHNQDFFRPLKVAVLSREAINEEAYSDHIKVDVVMPAHVVTEASIDLSTDHRGGSPKNSCNSLPETKIIPSLTTVQVTILSSLP
jgi:hypothetical protein